ncbi:MAG: ATP synthase F1 subunit delta [Abitibacteriaceae bacterium]|nr:ATP synthase F1 subunit delta [Abditibacteriaceae bacterium]
MAGDLRAARRYAGALFGLARQRNEISQIAAGIQVISQAVNGSPQLLTILEHPRITRDRKKELLRQVFSESVPADVEHFLFLLIDKERANIIPEVLVAFARLLDEYSREVDVEAVTALPMTEAQTEALRQRLEASSGYKVRLTTRVDESILGGLIVRIGDKLIDGSIATQLQAMREQLKQAKVS